MGTARTRLLLRRLLIPEVVLRIFDKEVQEIRDRKAREEEGLT